MTALMALVLSIIAAFIPTVFYVILSRWVDLYEREPGWLLMVTFLWGAVPAIVISLVAELVLDVPLNVVLAPEGAGLVSVAVVAPVVEEIAKAIPLAGIFLLYRHEFDSVGDGILYGALVGFGFAMTENVFYFLGAMAEGGLTDWTILVVLRAIIFGLNHALFTAATGAALGYARYTMSRPLRLMAPFLGLGLAILLHVVHNLFVSLDSVPLCFVSLFSDWLGVLTLVGAAYWASRQESRWIIDELQEEVAAGRLRPADALAAGNYRLRLQEHAALRQLGDHSGVARRAALHDAAAELGLKKRQFRLYGNERNNAATIEMLRQRIMELA